MSWAGIQYVGMAGWQWWWVQHAGGFGSRVKVKLGGEGRWVAVGAVKWMLMLCEGCCDTVLQCVGRRGIVLLF